jgi:AraC-like DNA-binding protein
MADDSAVEDVLAEVLASNAVHGAVAARTELAAPWAIRFPRVARAGFHIVTRGSCYLRVDEDEPVPLSNGDVVLLPHGSEHLLSSAPRASGPTFGALLARPGTEQRGGMVRVPGPGPVTAIVCGVYLFANDEPHPVLVQLPKLIRVRDDDAAVDAITAVIRLLVTELAREHAGARTVVARLVDVLFVLLVRRWVDTQPMGVGGWLGALRDPRIGRVLARLHRHPDRHWTVMELAEVAAMSPAAFKRRFSALVGRSPVAYLTRARMDAALRLLRRTDASLAEIASAVGYESEFAFGRAFKREHGLAPGRYRSLYSASDAAGPPLR